MQEGLRSTVIVLTYHDVIDRRGPKSLWFDTTVAELNEQLAWLKRQGASFITLSQLYAHLTEGTALPPKPVAVTFADNYLGFYQLGYPILKKLQVPATQFVHTGHVGSPKGRPKMTWDQLRQLEREGLVAVESQTVSHPPDLTKLSDDALRREFLDSKAALEQQLRRPIRFLAYPSGKYNARVANVARESGYLMAFTESQRPAERATSILMVPRYVHTRLMQAWKDVYGRAQ